ncbi:MAG: ATP-binding cassette domain-containing protein [Anaerolineae bacterium]|nr:ATP-binding cassette domain-containing protein [Anaerolineae bacterium]
MPDAILETAGLWFWYDKGIPVLRDVNLAIAPGEFMALVGANGSGKTTLVKHFNGLLRPRRGRVWVAGQDAAGQSMGALARQVGYLFQRPEQQIFSPTVRQELAFGPRNLGLSQAQIEARVDAALVRFRLAAVAGQPPAILSYGLRRRVTLASLAAMDPPVLVLDEPTVGLDARGLEEAFGWLADLHAQGRTILLVTHDMALAAAHAERVVVLGQGQVIADGPPAEVFGQNDLLARAALVPPPVTALAQALRSQGMRGDSLTVEAFCDEYVALTEIPHKGSVTMP